jgi:hypothetical protein
MASALYNMMVDDEKKTGAPAGGPTPAPTNAAPVPVSIPPATPPAPQQLSPAGGPSGEPGINELLDILSEGRGPVRPSARVDRPSAVGPRRPLAPRRTPPNMPDFDWRSDAGGTKPAFTEYEGESTTDAVSGKVTFTPKLDAAGNKIVKRAGRDLDFEAADQAAAVEGRELPDTQTRIKDVRPTGQGAGPSPRTSADDLMDSARYDAGVEQAFQAGNIGQQERDAQLGSQQRATFGQGFTSEVPMSLEEQEIAGLREKRDFSKSKFIDTDPLQQPPANIRETLRADTLIRDTIKKGGNATNPFSVVQTVFGQLQNDVRRGETKAVNLERGLISEVASIWGQGETFREDHPFTKIARESYGKTLDEVVAEYKRTTGQDLFTPKLLTGLQRQMATKATQYRADSEAIKGSVGYSVLTNAIEVGNNERFNASAKSRVAKGAIAYLASIPLNDEADVADAKNYFNMSLYGDPSMKYYQEGIEKFYADDPVLGVVFKTGAAGGTARAAVSMDKVRGATAEVFKTAIDDANYGFVNGTIASDEDGVVVPRTGRQAQVRLMNDFTFPFYKAMYAGDPIEGFKALNGTSFGRYFANNLAFNLQVLDTDNTVKQIFESEDNEAKTAVMNAITAPFGIKRAMRNLFTFDIAGQEDQFAIDVPKIQDAMKSGDMLLAKQMMAPYASTDQLDILFGEDGYVEGQGKQRELKLVDLEEMRGVGGSRKQRLDAYLGKKESYAAASEKMEASVLKMAPDQLIARLTGAFKIDQTLLGGYTGETRKAYNMGYIADTDVTGTQKAALADIVTYLSPTRDGSMSIADDPIFTQTLTTVDDAISKLNLQINQGTLSGYQEEAAKSLLKELKSTRQQALSNLDDFVAAGVGRKHLFALTPDGPDYSRPISAAGSASRVAQVTDMLGAWLTGTKGVDVNRYFKSTTETTQRASNRVLVTPIDRNGNAIPSQIAVSVKKDADGFVQYPVYEKEGTSWVPAKDIFGRPITSSAPLNKAQQATASLFGKAANDTASGNRVNDDYKRQQVNDIRVHLQNIIEPSGKDAAERRKYLIEEIGIFADTRSRIENAEVMKFLQKMDPQQGRKLLGYLEAYGQSESLKPDANVNWAMNATSTRGRSFGTDDKAIGEIEKESRFNAVDNHRTTVFTLASQSKNIIRTYADELMDGRGIADPSTRTAAADQVMKSLIKSLPMLGANNMQTAQVRDYMRDYIDAYLSDDADQIKVVNTQLRDFVENFEVTPEAADKAQQELIRGSKLNLRKPAQQESDARTPAQIVADAKAKNDAARSQNRSQAKYYATEFFPQLGWIYADGTEASVNQFRTMAQTAQKRGNSRGLDPRRKNMEGITIKQPTANDIAIAKKDKPDYKRVPGGTKIRQQPRNVESTQRTISQPKPNINKTPAVLLKGKQKPSGGTLRTLGTLATLGGAISTQGKR